MNEESVERNMSGQGFQHHRGNFDILKNRSIRLDFIITIFTSATIAKRIELRLS